MSVKRAWDLNLILPLGSCCFQPNRQCFPSDLEQVPPSTAQVAVSSAKTRLSCVHPLWLHGCSDHPVPFPKVCTLHDESGRSTELTLA